MTQQIFRKINYPLHLKKSILSLALETAHLNSNIKTLILDRDIKLKNYLKIRENLEVINSSMKKLRSSHFTEINEELAKKTNLKNKLGYKQKNKDYYSLDTSLIREINSIKEKLSKL